MHFYKIHIGDHLRATGHCSMLEEGALFRMANVYFDRELPLPAQKPQIYRLVGARTPSERKAVDVVLGERFDLRDDGWHERTFDEQIAAFKANSAKARYAANVMHTNRRSALSPSDASAVHPQCIRTANQEPETKNTRTTNPTANNTHPQPKAECEGVPQLASDREVRAGFETFWNAAPRRKKEQKQQTLEAYVEAVHELRAQGYSNSNDFLAERIAAYAKECELLQTPVIYIKYAKNWLAARRWEDEYSGEGS